jgi:hypothetical protein
MEGKSFGGLVRGIGVGSFVCMGKEINQCTGIVEVSNLEDNR